MKGLGSVPNLKDFAHAYKKLQAKKKITLNELALWSQWSRFDARLAEQLVAGIFRDWKKISPLELNAVVKKQPWPSAMGVVLEHVKIEQSGSDNKLFRTWADMVMCNVAQAAYEQFFIGTSSLGSVRVRNDAMTSTNLYLVWGYLGRDYLWNKRVPKKTISGKNARRNVIEKMIRSNQRISVNDYLLELNHTVSRRQAERDLAKDLKLKPHGNTRNRYYRNKD